MSPFAKYRTIAIGLSAAAARRAKRGMQSGRIKFGLREAIVLAIGGVVIAVAMVAVQLSSGTPLR